MGIIKDSWGDTRVGLVVLWWFMARSLVLWGLVALAALTVSNWLGPDWGFVAGILGALLFVAWMFPTMGKLLR